MKKRIIIFIVCILAFVFSIYIFTSNDHFMTHGPLVGGVSDESAILWMRADTKTTVDFRYSTDKTLRMSNISYSNISLEENDFTVTAKIEDLLANTLYYYTPRINGKDVFEENYPYFRTAISAGNDDEFSFVILTDFNTPDNKERPQTFVSASSENSSFTIIGGDFDHRGPGKHTDNLSVILENTRTMYKENMDRNDMRRIDLVEQIFYKGSIMHLWDDHDFAFNNADGTYLGKNISVKVYDEYFPSYNKPHPEKGIFQSWIWGDVEFFLLDGRYNRDPSKNPDDSNKSMLGDIQKTWLKQELENSNSTWKIILSGSVFNPTVKCGADNWCEYQNESSELVNFIADEEIKNILIISGDIHAGGITDGTNNVSDTLWEMVVPGADVINPRCDTTTYQGPNKFGEWTEGTYGQGEGVCWGYGKVEVLTNPSRLKLYVKNQDGETMINSTILAK